jgi:hypothetical protein
MTAFVAESSHRSATFRRLIALHQNRNATRGLGTMSEREMEAKLIEVDRLLNDPEVQMDPHRVWKLLSEISSAAKPVMQPAVAA